MPEINTLSEARQNLIDGLQMKIIPDLKCRRFGYQYPFFFVKLSSSDVHRMITEMDTSTVQFGVFINELKREFYRDPEKSLLTILWGLFWWPAVDRIWPLQCFQVHGINEDPDEKELYLLARTGPDEWVGVQTKVNYSQNE
jgi:hypothetical protein